MFKVRQLRSGRARIQTQAIWLRVCAPDCYAGHSNTQTPRAVRKMANMTWKIRVTWRGLQGGPLRLDGQKRPLKR